MRLSQSESVVGRKKGQKSRNNSKAKKKHKRLDAICEKTYNRNHAEVKMGDSTEVNNGGNESELRRSSRHRRAPALLDTSPLPPKKRQKVGRSGDRNVEKGNKGAKREAPYSSSRDLGGENSGWGARLRSRRENTGLSGNEEGVQPARGKRKLFEDLNGAQDDAVCPNDDKKEELVGDKSTVVKLKRPGRVKTSIVVENEEDDVKASTVVENEEEDIKAFTVVENEEEDIKASTVVENEEEDIDFGGKAEDDEGKDMNVAVKVINEGGGLPSEMRLECGGDNSEKEDSPLGATMETAVQKVPELEDFSSNGNLVKGVEQSSRDRLQYDSVPDQRETVEIDPAMDNQLEDEGDKARDDGQHAKPGEIEKEKELKEKCSAIHAERKRPMIKLGRRCGLCGGGTDGKPPKILVVEGACSDNDAEGGSSASDEPNYDVWDGFGDQPGWLGRLLGPINDRFGIAGIWVHQHCAVWSPEVYFAGLGHLKNIRAALYRGRVLKCSRCGRPGATIGCRVDRCPKTYHLPCARSESCIFDHRKFLIACTDHRHLFQPHGIKKSERLKKMRAKKFKLEFRKTANDAFRKDIEAEDKWLEKCGEDEEFLKRESKRLHRDLCRIAPTYIGGANSSGDTQFQGWESVAGLEDVIQCMKEVVILPLLYPEYFSNLGLTPPRGVLLHGYPGTGKTLAVRALVGSCARGERRIAYFARKGADCLGKYVGDAERQLRLLFQVAERSQPSIIFFDEIDGLAPCRSKRQDQTHNSVVSTLLALMDGLNSRGSVIVIGATNRPDAVDSALRRPGRFDREIHFPLPSMKDREAILSLHTQKWPKPISGSLLTWVAKRTLGFAGADLQALCTQAAINALRRNFPLQKVLAEAGATSSCNNFPSIPTFVVEEKDWLKAISCAPPPCSRRESGIVLNDVLSSPLETHLVPCLLQPLTKLLVSLYLDERVWLPLSLNRCIKLVKNVIVSALESRKMQSDSWWSHIDDLLQDVDVTNEIVKNLLVSNVLTGESNLYGPSLMEENTDATYSKSFSSKWQHRGSYSRLQQNTPQPLSDEPGFQMLISGDSQCGQRHFASCLLHCFLGNVNIWKVDMASISHEGHGDLVHGLTRILMRCAGAKLCMLFMPAIELWAFESYEKSPDDDCESSSIERHASGEQTIFSHTAVKKPSYLWTSFIEQVESVRINTSLIVLATSALPVSFLPDRIKQFFGDEMAHNQLKHKVPRFLVQLDRKFDYDEVVNCFAADFSKNLAQHFVQSLHGKDHDHEDWIEKKWYHIAEGDVSKVCLRKSDQPSPSSLVPETNKMLKRKSSLSLAISAVGYQILCYPHFAELCWVTSKLKEGPCTSVSGPWRGWPFNSCIVRPVKSSEKVDANTSDSGTIKSKEPGFVRGIVAVGLSAYRGEYTSLREVSSEIQNVSETLSRRIDAKFQAGKDKSLFIRFLSQMAHLEDMVNSWAHNLQRLEVDNGVSENANNCTEVLDQKPPTSSVISQGLEVTENVHGETNTEDDAAIHSVEEPPQKVVLDINHNLKHGLASNEANLESPRKGNDQHDAETESPKPVKLLNGLAENIFNTQESYGPCDGPNDHVLELPPFAEESDQHNGLSFADNNVLAEKTTEEKDCDANYSSESSVTCFYQCCSECVINLKNLVLRILHIEKGHKASDLTIEELHDSLSSFSANLHLALSQLSPGEFSHMRREVDATKYLTCCRYQRVDMSECEIPDKLLITVCDCHDMNEQEKNSRASQDLVLKFVFKDGILVASDTTGTSDISYHCKFEKVCLCFLIEWLATMKDFS